MISLPRDFFYLGSVAACYGPAWRYWAALGRVERHPNAWRDLARTHQSICQREDAFPLAQWLLKAAAALPEREERRQVRGLLRLLTRLGRAGITPFNKPTLRLPRLPVPIEKQVCIDGGDTRAPGIPTRLRYLINRACRLGIRPGWDALSSYIDQVNERQFNALVATAHRMRRKGDDLRLRHWLVALDAQQAAVPASEETLIVRSLLHVLDALEIF